MELFKRIKPSRSLLRDLIVISILTVLYVIAAKSGLKLAFVNPSTTPVWPPTGIAISALLIFGYRVWPGIFIGAFLANLTTAGTILTSLGIAGGNTLEAVIATYFIYTFANGRDAFDNSRNIFKYTIFVIGATMISATWGVTSLVLGGFASWESYYSIWLTWWLGDIGGGLIVAPFLLLLSKSDRVILSNRKILETAGFIAALFIISMVIFGGFFPSISRAFPIEFLVIPILVWVAIRLGRRQTIMACVILSAVAIWGTLYGFGPFYRTDRNESLLLLQTFLDVITITSLMLATAVKEKKSVEKRLQSREELFHALIDNSYDAVVLIDRTSRILYASPSVKRVLGYNPEELIGKIGFDLVSPENRNMTMRELAKLVLKPGGVVQIQYQTIRKDKKTIWVQATGTNLLLDPNVNAVVVNFHDITERKLAQDRVLQEKAEDEALLASIGDGIIATDRNEKIILVSNAFEDLTGWKNDEVLHKNMPDILKLEDEEGKPVTPDQRPLYKAISTGKKITSNYYILRKNKSKFPALIVATPVILRGKTIGGIKVFHDMTREKEIDKAKTEFVSLASHQLRTPPSIIKWYAELLLKELNQKTLTHKEMKYLHQIYAASQRMIELVNALLDISRLELGTFVIQPKEMNIVDVAKHEISQFQRLLTAKKLDLQENYLDGLPVMRADPELVGIIVQNLLSNAIKYTPEKGKISLIIAPNSKDRVKLTISDNGYGIPTEQHSKIFTKLFRADNIKSVDTQGTGLGLYLVKSILDRVGGSITFASQQNKGTTFTLLIPTVMKEEKRRYI